MSTITATVQLRRDTAANWTANNPTLLSGEVGFETDTRRSKLGNGSTAWNSLPYINGTAAQQDSSAFDPAGSASAAQAFAIQRSNHTGTQLASTISDFAATVRSTVLTGLSLASSAAVDATDSILSAFGKLQAFNNLFTTVGLSIARLANPSAVRFLRINSDNTVTARSAADLRTDLGLGTAALSSASDFDLAANTVRSSLASDFTTSSATYVDVAPSGVNFEVTLEANSTYWFYLYGVYQSANTGTGVGVSFTFSNSPTLISLFGTRGIASSGTTATAVLITVNDGGTPLTSVTDANANLPFLNRGVVVTGANPSVVRVRLARGGAANNVTLKAGSIILAHKII